MRGSSLPRILVIDDVYGRDVAGGNCDRAAICAELRLATDGPLPLVLAVHEPIARATFCRGQRPVAAVVGDRVENDLDAILTTIDDGWHHRAAGEPPWSLVLLDLRFRTGVVTHESERRFGRGIPAGDEESDAAEFGLRVLEEIQQRYPQLPVVVLSDAQRDLVSRQLTALGAMAFLGKGDPFAADKLAEHLRRHALLPDPEREIVGTSIRLLVALRNARRAASGSDGILIRGETGTGKELLARYIHRNDAARRGGPLVVVDSGTLSPELYASELFGHMRGAFTSAISDRPGRIVEAHRGVLFLDEIGNVDVAVQRGLLRVLQEKQVRPVGGSRARDVDVRFVFATNEDIESRAAADDGFRLDLLERVRQGGTIVLPPLRERAEDIPALVEAIVREAEARTPGAMRRRIDDDTLTAIARHPWPGNIRQLRSCLSAAVRARPDVEHLVPIHLDLPPAGGSASPRHAAAMRGDSVFTAARSALETLDPSRLPMGELVGAYTELESAFARMSMRWLRGCIDATRKTTVRNPRGEVLVHPAVKVMLGASKLSASQAYDFIIRLRNLSPAIAGEWDADEVLGPLFERARAQRRSRTRRDVETPAQLEGTHG